MATVDVETRWGSTYDMLKRLLDLSSFCKINEGLNDKLKLTQEGWKELQEIVESLAPVRTLTTKLQEGALTSGQTLGHWQLYMLSLQQISTPLAAMLMERMKEREKSLMIPPVLVATYLDPEYQMLLTEEQRNSAKIELQALYKKLLLLKHQEDSLCGKDHEL